MELDKGEETNRAMNEEKGDEHKAVTFGKENNPEVLEEFPPW